jgi:hypothetical protein
MISLIASKRYDPIEHCQMFNARRTSWLNPATERFFDAEYRDLDYTYDPPRQDYELGRLIRSPKERNFRVIGAVNQRLQPVPQKISTTTSGAINRIFYQRICDYNAVSGVFIWPNRDPLGDDGSLVYAVTRIEPRLEPWSAAERAMMVQQFEDPLSAFTQVNLNTSLALANNPIDNVDPRGLDWLDCMANCVKAHDPANNAAKACGTFLGGTFPKAGSGTRTGLAGGGSRVTTILSRLGLGGGVGNTARVVGRFFSPIWVGYGLYLAGAEAACAGTCSGDPTAY